MYKWVHLPPRDPHPVILLARVRSTGMKWSGVSDVIRTGVAPETYHLDLRRVLKSWSYRIIDAKMGRVDAHKELAQESKEVQKALLDKCNFHIEHAMKNNQTGKCASE